MPYPDFSDQVYELLDIARTVRASLPSVTPPLVELVWVVPHDTAPESALIKPPMSQVMRDYDRGADLLFGREL
jgi:hypothetical protein